MTQEQPDFRALSIGAAPETAEYLVRCFGGGTAAAAVSEGMRRFLWNANYGFAVPLANAGPFFQAAREGSFVYHQRSGLLFTEVAMGWHQVLMAYLGALHLTDWSTPYEDWSPSRFFHWDASAKAADSFIEGGHGLFRSSVGARDVITVSRSFRWLPQERMVFASFQRRYIG